MNDGSIVVSSYRHHHVESHVESQSVSCWQDGVFESASEAVAADLPLESKEVASVAG